MPAAVYDHELHLDFGVVVPAHPSDVSFVGRLDLIRFRRTGEAIEIRKVLPRLSRRQNLAALQQAEELDLSTLEWI